jgi:flagellar motor switch protein FliN
MEKQPYYWIKKISKAALLLDEMPLISSNKNLDLNKLADFLSKTFSNKNIQIETGEINWQTEDSSFENNTIKKITLNPLKGDLFLLMQNDDIKKIAIDLMVQEENTKQLFSESETKAFYDFILLEALSSLDKMQVFEGTNPKISSIKSISSPYLVIDIKVTINSTTYLATLCLSQEFRKSWQNHIKNKKIDLNKSFEVPLSLQCGQVNIKKEMFDNLKKGDFVILDELSYYPLYQKNLATLYLENTPLFLIKIKENKVKLLDYASYYEVNEFMEKEENIDENEDIEEEIYEEEEDQEEIKEKVLEKVEEKNIDINNVPITLTIEIAKIKMTLEKLMQLTPGNLLDLNISPEEEINITISGKKVAKGELLNLGETLGVRITNIEK